MKYSASTKGFYLPEIHGEKIPDDAVDITDERYVELLEGQCSGKEIVPDENGEPVLMSAPEHEPET